MKKTFLYVTYDKLTENLSPVFFAANNRMAKTMFLDSIKKNDLSERLDDFALYCIGGFDTPTNLPEVDILKKETISLVDEATNETKPECSEK